MLEKFKEVASVATVAKVEEMIREFNDTIPTIKALGLSVSKMRFKMAVPPEIGARFTGSVAALDQEKIKGLIERNRGKKFVTVLLETLRAAANLKDQLIELEFRGVSMDVELGMSPNVEVGLLTKEDSPGTSL